MLDRKSERRKIMNELTRQDILDAAVAVLLKKTVKGFTMEAVAKDAGIAKGTLYLYFKNKQALLDAVVDYCFEPLDRKIEEIIGADQDPIRKLEQCALVALKHSEKHRELYRQLISEIFNITDRYISDKKSWYWSNINLVSKALDEAVITGKFRPMNTEKIAALFFNSLNSLMSHRTLFKHKEPIEEDVRDLMQLFINGLRYCSK